MKERAAVLALTSGLLSLPVLAVLAARSLSVFPIPTWADPAAAAFLAAALGAGTAAWALRGRELRALRNAEADLEAGTRALEGRAGTAEARADALRDRIGQAVSRTVLAIHRLEGLASGTADGIEVLAGALDTAAESSAVVVSSQTALKRAIGSYSEEVQREAEAAQSMARSVSAVAESSRRKREKAAQMIRLSGGAEERLQAIRTSVNRMAASVEKMRQVNSVVTEVADRTSLLAMNASIEAAHAGQAGKGFAVIANAVRALSNEAAEGSKAIQTALQETEEALKTTAAESDGAVEYFSSVFLEIQDTAAMLEQNLVEMQAASQASSGILESARRLDGLCANAQGAVDSAETGTLRSRGSLETVLEIARTIRSDAASMMTAFREILDETEALRRLGSSPGEPGS